MKIKKLGPNMTELEYADGTRILVSYETPVAAYLKKKGYVRATRFYSRSTAHHIRQWLGEAHAQSVPDKALLELMEVR